MKVEVIINGSHYIYEKGNIYHTQKSFLGKIMLFLVGMTIKEKCADDIPFSDAKRILINRIKEL
jgi:hypothetical protein